MKRKVKNKTSLSFFLYKETDDKLWDIPRYERLEVSYLGLIQLACVMMLGDFGTKSNKIKESDILKIWNDSRRMKINLACGQDIRPTEKNWVNVDTVAGPGVLQMNIFKLPWHFESDSFDYVLARHIFEHVPHNIPEYEYEHNFLQLFMEEIWRVMKVGAILDIEVPGGISSLARAMDHKRIVTPESLHVFYGKDEYAYYTPCRFELVSVNRFEPFWISPLRLFIQKMFHININHLRSDNIRFFLRKLPKNEKCAHFKGSKQGSNGLL